MLEKAGYNKGMTKPVNEMTKAEFDEWLLKGDTKEGSALERAFDTQFQRLAHDLPSPINQHRFVADRRWKIDRAWPDMKIAVELHGGTKGYRVHCHQCGTMVRAKKKDGTPGKFLTLPGNHSKPGRIQGDMEKANRLALEGWLLLTFHTDDVTGNPFDMIDTIRKAIDIRQHLQVEEYNLTEREIEVLHCIAGGFKTKEIAERLNCKEFTISSHVDNILTKMAAQNRSHAIALSAAQGILDFEQVPWAIEVSFD